MVRHKTTEGIQGVITGELVSATGNVRAVTGGSATVPILLTTEGPGFTGGTFVICHDPAILDFVGVEPSPEVACYSPELSYLVWTSSGFQVTLALATAIPEVTNFPVILPRYRVKGTLGQVSPIRFCDEGATKTLIRFGDVNYQPQTVAGSVKVAIDSVPATFSIPNVEAGIEVDPIPVAVESVFDIPEGVGIQGFQVTLSFDPENFSAVDEGSAEGHRGSDLAAFLSGKTPVSETRTIQSGSFRYAVTFDVPLARADAPSYLAFSLVKLRLARKSVPLPGGGSGKRSGFVDFLRLTPGENTYTLAGSPELATPWRQDGLITVGVMGSRFEVSSVEAMIFQYPQVTVSFDSPVGGIVALAYNVRHVPSLLSIYSLRDTPELQALSPDFSTFTQAGDSFKHEVVFDPARPLGQVDGFPLSRVEYVSKGDVGKSIPIEVVARSGSLRSSIAVSVAGDRYDIIPGTVAGEIRLIEDPNLLAYKARGGRAPPGSLFVASILIDAAIGGVPGFEGSLAHDPTMADVDPDYLGGWNSLNLGPALKTINNGGPPDYYVVIAGSGLNGEQGVTFGAVFSGSDPLNVALPPGLDLDVFHIGYRLNGLYGDVMPLWFTDELSCSPYGYYPVENIIVSRDARSVFVKKLIPGEVILTDPLAPTIPVQTTPGTLRGIAVTEFGWRWGFAPGTTTVRHYMGNGSAFGTDVTLPAIPRRIASGGEGWAMASLPGEVAFLRYDLLERRVALTGEPYGIIADRMRNFWVAVSGDTGRLLRISRDGMTLLYVTLPARDPRELTIDEEGAVWVAYKEANFLSRLAADGALLRPIAAQLRSSQPAGLAADGRGTIWASDSGDRSLLAFDLEGREVRRIPLGAEPTDISLDGKGAIWTVLKAFGGSDKLVKVQPDQNPVSIASLGESGTYFGDRTGLNALRLLLPGEDNDGDGIANLLEIKGGTDPLDPADPLETDKVLPVGNLAAKPTSFYIEGGPGGGQTGTENVAGVTWKNSQGYTRHTIGVEGGPTIGDVPGPATSASLSGLPPGPSTVVVKSFLGNLESPEVSTSLLFGPGTSLKTASIAQVEPYDIAFNPTRNELYVLDGAKNLYMVLDKDFQIVTMFAIPLAPLGDSTAVLTGLAFDAAGDGGAGSLIALERLGRYQEFALDGSAIGGLQQVPYTQQETSFFYLKAGKYQGKPAFFSVARGPMKDDIIVFFRTGGGEALRIRHPLSGGTPMHFTLGGIAFRRGSQGEADRLWICTGLEGDALARLVLEIPLDGSPSQGRVLLSIFDKPEGIPQVRGIDISPEKGDLYVATSDRRYHLLSDLGVVRGAEGTPRITRIMTGDGQGAVGPVGGGTELVIEGQNFGSDLKDLRVILGKSTAENLRLESAGGLDRLTVLSPPGRGTGPVPVFLFRTRALDFRQSGFYYCDEPAGSGPDCNSDGIPDACQIQWNDCNRDGMLDSCQLQGHDCNFNGLLDSCDIAYGTSLDADGNALPDECIPFLRGDPNDDGERNITDAIVILGFLFLGSPAALGCDRSADLTDDGNVNITDVVRLLSHLYLGTEFLPAPFPGCGLDTTPDGLTCETYNRCVPAP